MFLYLKFVLIKRNAYYQTLVCMHSMDFRTPKRPEDRRLNVFAGYDDKVKPSKSVLSTIPGAALKLCSKKNSRLLCSDV